MGRAWDPKHIQWRAVQEVSLLGMTIQANRAHLVFWEFGVEGLLEVFVVLILLLASAHAVVAVRALLVFSIIVFPLKLTGILVVVAP